VAQIFYSQPLPHTVFFTGRPRLTQAGLPSPRGASPHTGRPHTGRPPLTPRSLPSHREAPPHTGRPPLTQRGPTSHREAPPHLTQANLMQTCFPSQESLTSHRQTLHRHSSSRMSVPKRKANKRAQRGKSKAFGCLNVLKLNIMFITTERHFSITHGQPHTRPLFRTHPSK
jgi:hypothetical protein